MLVRVIKSGPRFDLSVEYAVLSVVRPENSSGEVVSLDYCVPGKYQSSLFTPDLFLVPRKEHAGNLFIHGAIEQRVFVFGGSRYSVLHTGYLMPGNSNVRFSKVAFDEKQTFGLDCFAISKEENGKFFVWKWQLMLGCPKGSVFALDKASKFKVASDQNSLSEESSIFFWMLNQYLGDYFFLLNLDGGYWFHALACIGLEFFSPEFEDDSRKSPFQEGMKFPSIFNRVFSKSEIAEFCREFIQAFALGKKFDSALSIDLSLKAENLIVEIPINSSRLLFIDLQREEREGRLPSGFCSELRNLIEESEA